MVARWFHVKLRAAEKALDQGRIDDAYRTVTEQSLANDNRAQRLVQALTRALTARARLHRQAGRHADALADLDRLAAIGPADPDIETLRQRIRDEMGHQAAEARAQRDAVARAAERIEAGRLETGRLDIQNVEDTRQRAELADDLARRIERGAQLLEQAREALGRGDWLVAVRLWQDARQRHGITRESEQVAARLVAAGRDALALWHREGRLERLLAAHDAVRTLAAHDPSLSEQERLIDLCRRASTLLAAHEHDRLRRTLLRIQGVAGEAPWLHAALKSLAQISEGQERLLASPLGLYASRPGDATAATRVMSSASISAEPDPARARPAAPARRAPASWLVLVDGGGSSLLLQRDLVRLGRAGSSAEIDVPIPADIESHHADIVRRGDDYFISGYGLVEVNRRRTEHALLRDGDRIALNGKAKMTFRQPSSMSTSAVLIMSHRCRLPQDVSEVILFRDTCLIGPDTSCHIRTNADHGRVVLFERSGKLAVRQVAGPGHLTNVAQAITAGETLEFNDLRMTVKDYGSASAQA